MKPYSPLAKLCLILLLVLFQRHELYANANPEPLAPSFQPAAGGGQVQVLYLSPEEGEAFRRSMEAQGAIAVEVRGPAELEQLLAQAEVTPTPSPLSGASSPGDQGEPGSIQVNADATVPALSFKEQLGRRALHDVTSQIGNEVGKEVGKSMVKGISMGGGGGNGDGLAGLLLILGVVIVIGLIIYAVYYLLRTANEERVAYLKSKKAEEAAMLDLYPATAKEETTGKAVTKAKPADQAINKDEPVGKTIAKEQPLAQDLEPTESKKGPRLFSSRYWLGRDSAYRFWFGRGAASRRWGSLGLGVYGFRNSKEWGGLSSVHFAMGPKGERFEWGVGAELGWINSSVALEKDRPNLKVTGAYVAAGPLLVYNLSYQSHFYLELLGGTSEHKEVHVLAKGMVGYRWQSNRGLYLAVSTGSLMVSLKSSLGYVRDQNPFNWLSGLEAGWTF